MSITIPSAGAPSWQTTVASSGDLPLTGNQNGDARAVSADGSIFVWNGSSWISATTGIVTGASNLGGGTGVYKNTSSGLLRFNSLNAGANMTIADDGAGNITLTGAAPGSGGLSTIGTIDSQSRSVNGLVVSGSSIYAQTATTGFPGLINSTVQNLGGIKYFRRGSDYCTIGASGFTSWDGFPVFQESVFTLNNNITFSLNNLSSGSAATCDWWISNDVASGRLALGATSSGHATSEIYYPDMTYAISDGDGGFMINSTPPSSGADIMFGTANHIRHRIKNDGTTVIYGSARLVSTDNLTIDPGIANFFNATVVKNNTVNVRMANSSTGNNAYCQVDIAVAGADLGFGIGGSGLAATTGIFPKNGGYLTCGGVGGFAIAAQDVAGTFRVYTGGSSERMRIRANGIVNIANVPNYANNAAAVAAGLLTGDLYQTSGAMMIVT